MGTDIEQKGQQQSEDNGRRRHHPAEESDIYFFLRLVQDAVLDAAHHAHPLQTHVQ